MFRQMCSCCARSVTFYLGNESNGKIDTCHYCKHYIGEFSSEFERKLVSYANLLMVANNKARKARLKEGFQHWYNKWEMCVNQRFNIGIDGYSGININGKVSWDYLDLLAPRMRGITQ